MFIKANINTEKNYYSEEEFASILREKSLKALSAKNNQEKRFFESQGKEVPTMTFEDILSVVENVLVTGGVAPSNETQIRKTIAQEIFSL